MIAYTRSQLVRLLRLEFIRFCIVGGTGFIINLILLTLLRKYLHLEIFVAQLISAEIALFSNFMFHHHWTYKAHHVEKSITKLIIQFHSTSWPAIAGSAGMVFVAEKVFHLNDIDSLLISSLIALIWNYFWSKFVVWRDVKPGELKEISK